MSPIPAVVVPWGTLLVHDPNSFDPAAMQTQSSNFRVAETLERFAWDLEVLAQLEALSPKGALTFAGGGCTMLHLDTLDQRVSVDLDLYFWLGSRAASEAGWEDVLNAFAARLGRQDANYLQLVKYVPNDPKVTLPMTAYNITCPTSTGQTVLGSGIPGCRIKVEVIFAEPASRIEIPVRGVLPFPATGPHVGYEPLALIASKMLALSIGEVGLQPKRMDELVKHVHDIAKLQARHLLTIADFEKLKAFLKAILNTENSWHKRQSRLDRCQVAANTMMNVFESSLLRQSISDFENNNMRQALGDELWQTWPRLVRLLFSAAVGPHQRTEFLEARRILDDYLWIGKIASPQERTALETSLLNELNAASFGRRAILKGLSPSALFIELVFDSRIDAAIDACRVVFGQAWPPFAITSVGPPPTPNASAVTAATGLQAKSGSDTP